MSKFKKWWNKQNDITLRMAVPEIIAESAWNVAIDEAIGVVKDIEKKKWQSALNFDTTTYPAVSVLKELEKLKRGKV